MSINLDEAARLFLERSLRTNDPAVIVDVFDPTDANDNYPETVHPVYARNLRSWLSPESGVFRVEATLDAPTVPSISVATPLYGNLVAVNEWTVNAVDPFSGLTGAVSASGWVPELAGHPSSRNSKASSYEANGQVVGAVSAALKGAAGTPWTTGFPSIRVTADQVQNSAGGFLMKVSIAGTPVASSVLLTALSPWVGKLVAVNVGVLTAASAADSTTVLLTVS